MTETVLIIVVFVFIVGPPVLIVLRRRQPRTRREMPRENGPQFQEESPFRNCSRLA
ncbi:hypothetical protein L0152_10150 [bacterium]|nr:hypothetical protein [bacterium]